jgi:hypothetical protein
MLKQMAMEMERDDFGSCNAILTERSIPLAKKAVAQQLFGTLEQRGQMSDMGKVRLSEGREERSDNCILLQYNI